MHLTVYLTNLVHPSFLLPAYSHVWTQAQKLTAPLSSCGILAFCRPRIPRLVIFNPCFFPKITLWGKRIQACWSSNIIVELQLVLPPCQVCVCSLFDSVVLIFVSHKQTHLRCVQGRPKTDGSRVASSSTSCRRDSYASSPIAFVDASSLTILVTVPSR